MGNYRNFELAVYFVAFGTKHADEKQLKRELAFFKKHMGIDKVYIETYRDGVLAPQDKVDLVKHVFEEKGIKTAGGITSNAPTPDGDEEKQRIFNTLCYNDEKMLSMLETAAVYTARNFDEFIIDDFYFTNCTCAACRAAKDAFNEEHGITDGSWQEYRTSRMAEVSEKYIIAPAKEANPQCKITIKYPNWMESYQETGYCPAKQKELFDRIYTGTETRDARAQDQHLPRYLSYSLMRYMEEMAPDRNGGGWFDPFDCTILEYYLEQAMMTALSKPKELMMFCFQALVDTINVPALGFLLDKLDATLDSLGNPVGIPAYIPDSSQGEDNVTDYLGMCGFPVYATPVFDETRPVYFFTQSSLYDKDIVDKLEKYVAAGNKAIVTSGFAIGAQELGFKNLSSIRFRNRRVSVKEYVSEIGEYSYRWEREFSREPISFPLLEFRNNSTWGELCKGMKDDESYTLFSCDTYGKGKLYTMVIPDSFSDIKYIPETVLNRMRKEFAVDGTYIKASPMTSIFHYDNDTFVLYAYAGFEPRSRETEVHVRDSAALLDVESGRTLKPRYYREGEAVYCFRLKAGKLQTFMNIPAQK